MEKILVSFKPGESSLWAGMHALHLAKRISARVSFLLILEQTTDALSDSHAEMDALKKLSPLLDQGRSEGITVDYFVTSGDYDTELVKFIKENRITMLVVGSPSDQKGASGHFTEFLEKVRHRIDCRIEVVHKKNLKRRR